MVAKMMKWSPWPPSVIKKFQVKVKLVRLEGLGDNYSEAEAMAMAIQLKWKGEPKSGLVPLTTKRQRRDISSERIVTKGEAIEWEDEFENLCRFSMVSNDKYLPWEVSFNILYRESKGKLVAAGKVSLNIAEMALMMEPTVERSLPINLKVAGVAREATLTVSVSFAEIRDIQNSVGLVQNSGELENLMEDRLEIKKKERKKQLSQEEMSLSDSEVVQEKSLVTGSGSSLTPETQSDPVKIARLFSWKRRKLSFRSPKMKAEPLIKKNGDDSEAALKADANEPCSAPEDQEESRTTGSWETKELVSRDGQTKLNADVYFASFDQRSDKAAGESACTALVAVIAHWLQSNPNAMPTRSEFNSLIVEGSSEWRSLCENEAYVNQFPNKHLDLETVLNAEIRPINVLPEKSFIGFFGAEKFESLKGAMSFDQIWDEISSHPKDIGSRIYIVSWNDHFFVLKADADAYYIIDTLGERLYEGCSQAFILRFDDSTLMRGKIDKEKETAEKMEETGTTDNKEKVTAEKMEEAETTVTKEEKEDVTSRGKECCREFIKRFLAAIPLGELEAQEKKEAVSYYSLHHRLQIEFNYSFLLSSSLSSLSSSPSHSSACSSTSSAF